MKKSIKVLTALCLILHIVLNVCGCSFRTKQREKHVYEWLLENGQLLDGADLVYKQTGDSGDLFVLHYSPNASDMMYIEYSTNYNGYQISARLPLFSEDDNVQARIEAESEKFEYRGLEYSLNRKKFTRNSPIEYDSWYGNIKPSSITFYSLERCCEDYAQISICKILDWLNESLCPSLKMNLKDFGYRKYQ